MRREMMNISLPPKLKKGVDRLVKEGNYASRSEFVREILRLRIQPTKPKSISTPISVAEVKRKAAPILKRAGVCRASVFGSVARGEANPNDVDILVEFSKGKVVGLFGFVGLKQELEEKLGCKVDLGTYKSIRPLLKDRIMKDKIDIL